MSQGGGRGRARKLVIFGARAFAEVAHYYFTRDSDYDVVAFTVDGAYLTDSTFQGRPVIPFEGVARRFPPADHDVFVAVGIGDVNRQRAAKCAEVEASGYRLASFCSSKAHVPAGLEMRPNTMIMEGAGLHPWVEIGRNTVIWSATRIGFRTRIGDHCWLECATLGEAVTVADYSFIGLNATIASGITIGRGNVIGTGAVIVKDTRDLQIYRPPATRASRALSSRLWRRRR